MRQFAGFVLALAALVSLGAADVPASSRLDADALKHKIDEIARRGEIVPPPRSPLKTTITERETNAYLEHEVSGDLPAGVVMPSIAMLGAGRVTGRAVVDLDRVRKEMKARSIFNPISYLSGRLPVVATGAIRTGNGVGRFQFESASVGGVRVPKLVLQQIVGYYSRSERYPSGVSLDDPIALPAGIREIQVERGQAVVIQ
jgi:hypothetical protein